MNAMHLESEGYWGMDEYAYEMEALSRGRFGRNMRHEVSKQARHESKRARKLTQILYNSGHYKHNPAKRTKNPYNAASRMIAGFFRNLTIFLYEYGNSAP